jgi:hypothetical protein
MQEEYCNGPRREFENKRLDYETVLRLRFE